MELLPLLPHFHDGRFRRTKHIAFMHTFCITDVRNHLCMILKVMSNRPIERSIPFALHSTAIAMRLCVGNSLMVQVGSRENWETMTHSVLCSLYLSHISGSRTRSCGVMINY